MLFRARFDSGGSFSGSKRRYRILFWIAIIAVIAFMVQRIVAIPTRSAGTQSGLVVVNELMATNSGQHLLDEDGDPSDWIELVNRSSETVDLTDWTLTDDPARPDKWTFPSVSLSPDEYLIVFASGKDRRVFDRDQDGQDHLHTNFRLDSDVSFLALYPPTSRRYLDGSTVIIPGQEIDISYGLYRQSEGYDASYGFFLEPTPGHPNPDVPEWYGRTPPVTFSKSRGFYNDSFRLRLSTELPDAEIRYTLDGSEPGEAHGMTYDQPLAVSGTTMVRAVAVAPGYLPGPIDTRTYLFKQDVLAQADNPDGFPEHWGTHRIDFGGYAAGTPVDADYAMDSVIVTDPDYDSQMDDALTALPTLSLVLDIDDFDIYSDPQSRGRESERSVSVELFDSAENEPGFQIDAGLRIQGGAGRWEFMPKHSFRLFFRDEYGSPKLDYPLFSDSPVADYDTVILRAGTDRGFAGHPAAPGETVDHRQTTYARDEWTRASQIAMSGTGVHGRFVHLYINGLYWGIYNLVERPDADYMAAHFGGMDDEYASVNQAGSVSGLVDRTMALLRLAEAGGLADAETYATMLEFIDPIQFSDYIILNWYVGNEDWPLNNWYAGVRYPAGRNLFFVWDAEATLDGEPHVSLEDDAEIDAPYGNIIKVIFEALMENPEFRLLFADRLHLHTKQGGALSDTEAQQRWQDVTAPLAPAILAESARWGDVRTEDPITPTDWLAARDAVHDTLDGRGDTLRSLAQEAGYYPSIEVPMFSVNDPTFDDSVLVEMTAVTGDIFFTTDGSDPRMAGSGEPSPSASKYEQPLRLETVMQVKARTFDGTRWSALEEVTYRPVDASEDVRITELMYNPEGGDRYEFVELANRGLLTADLSGAYFTGIEFRFPERTVLDPGEVMVLVSDFKRFRERYAEAEITGIYEGKLSNRGESIELRARDGRLIDRVTYEDADGWPLSADGTGDSIELASPHGDLNQAHHWRASETQYGTPGTYAD